METGRYAGMQSIRLDQIVGTDIRIGDFDRDFLPQRAEERHLGRPQRLRKSSR